MHGTAVDAAIGMARQARASGHTLLLEPEAFEILETAGIRCPRRLFARNAPEAEHLDLASLGSTRAVVKVVSHAIAHKSDVGGVAIVENTPAAVTAAVRSMESALAGHPVSGFSIAECVAYDPSPGGEWLVGLRWTDEFGPVVTIGAGGVATEVIAGAIEPGRDVAVISPGCSRATLESALDRLMFTPLATGRVRKQAPRTTVAALCDLVDRLARLSPACRPDAIADLEINPLVASADGLIALDVLATAGLRDVFAPRPRPLRKLRNLLTPRSIAVAGVSSQMNPGRVILRNVIREGFDQTSIFVVKPATAEIDGCRAVPSIQALPQRVDLLVLSIPAPQVPEAILDVVAHEKAESVIVIPGGLEEKAGTGELLAEMHQALDASRTTAWEGPVVNGGNCLGIQSAPGRYDTMFLAPHKLGLTPAAQPSPVAIVSQSGAFAASIITRLQAIRPRYCITVGNQMDLTIGDYLQYLETDPDVRIVGLYVEGFRTLDGTAALDAIQRMTTKGVTVVLYRAGRTQAGAAATASHTASVAGDYTVTCELARAAGAIIADTLDDFTDLVSMFTLLRSKRVFGRRVGAVSNAGFECVAIADSLGELELPEFTEQTARRLTTLFEVSRLTDVVDVHNPLDLTPIMNDEGYEAAVRRVLEDDHVDVGVIGCVPATAALNTLPASAAHGEDLEREDSIAGRLLRLKAESPKPWVAVIDAGAVYDPLARRLEAGGIPTFRAADRALRVLNVFVADRFTDGVRAQMERWVDEFGQPMRSSPDVS